MLVPSLPILLLSLPLLSLPVHGSSLLQGGDLQSFDGETDGLVASPVWNPNLRPDARGFLGTPFGPVLDLGHVRFSIDHKRTQLGDLRDGTSTVSTEEALAGDYERVPTGGWTGATHLRSEFGLSENATIRLDIPFETRRIAYQFDDGSTQRFTAQGLADIRFQGSVELSFRDQERAELTLGMRVPTGSTRERESDVPGTVPNPRLPYFQQLGGGTYALEPALYWTHWGSEWSLGSGVQASLPMGTNDQGWSLGDAYGFQAWAARRMDAFRAVVVGIEYQSQGKIDGADGELDPLFDPSQDGDHVGGQVLSVNAGLHMVVEAGNHLAVEIGVPAWQDLNGPQTGEDFHFRVGWWLSF